MANVNGTLKPGVPLSVIAVSGAAMWPLGRAFTIFSVTAWNSALCFFTSVGFSDLFNL